MDNENLIIAIDGPTGTGKSITSQLLAEKLGFKYYDTGVFYRAVTYLVLKNSIKLNDYLAICKAAQSLDLKLVDGKVLLNDVDVTKALRGIEISNKVSGISKIGKLRQILNGLITKLNNGEINMVVEGKDIGTDVFPKAKFKFFLVSDLGTRIARRQQDFFDNGQKFSKDKIEREIKLRDDIEFKKSPAILKKAKDAITVDTTNMIVEEQVNYLFRVITNPETFLNQP